MIVFFECSTENRREDLQIFLNRKILVQGKTAGHVTNSLTDLAEMLDNIVSTNARSSAGG